MSNIVRDNLLHAMLLVNEARAELDNVNSSSLELETGYQLERIYDYLARQLELESYDFTPGGENLGE